METHIALIPGRQYPNFAQKLGDSLRQFLLDVGVRYHTSHPPTHVATFFGVQTSRPV